MAKKPQSRNPIYGNGSISETYSTSGWVSVPDAYFTDISVPLITDEIKKFKHVLIFLHVNSEKIVSLPMRFYVANTYASTIDAVHKKDTVRLIWTNVSRYDQRVPPELTITVITIDKEKIAEYNTVDLNNYSDVMHSFFE